MVRTEDDERTQAARELADAEGTLKNKVRNAYRHYANLTRIDDALAVEIPKFDDDTRTALSGTDVCGELVDASRAVGEHADPTTGQPRPVRRETRRQPNPTTTPPNRCPRPDWP